MKSVTAISQFARNWIVAFAAIIATCFAAPNQAIAETQAQTCDRLAGDAVKIDSIDGATATSACSNAVTASPQDKHLEYEYARALERSGQRDQAKQIYQWIAGDGYAPATAALARLAGPLTGDAADREKFAQKLDAIAAIAARIAKATPRDHDDPNTVLAKTGKDSARILAWVKTNTRIVPYAGMLRGASGVLMDRSGNSLDRALFLADLLHRAGYNVRIARAQISPQAAEALRVRFVSSAPKPTPPVVPNKAVILKAIGTDPRLDSKFIEKAVDETIASSRKFDADVESLYSKVLPAILQSVGNDPARDARLAADADAMLRDHFWVQRQNGSNWDDVDPDADIAGKSIASTTFLPSETPPELKHRVTLRLILETLKDGKLSETALIQQSWLPSEVADKPIVVNHALYPQVPIDALLKRANPQADFIQGLADAAVVMPILQVGAQVIRGQIYDFTGRVEPPTPANLASMGGAAIVNGQALARGIASAFGGSTPASAPEDTSTVTAEWLDIDVAIPGKSVDTHRRTIFDLIGATARANPSSVAAPAITNEMRLQRGLSLGTTIDAFVFGATPSSDWIERATMDGTARALWTIARTTRTAQSLTDAPPPSADRLETPMWVWAANRMASVLLPDGVTTAPNVALLWHALVPEPDARDHLKVAFDIVANSAAGDTSFSHRVAQGLMDTIMEHTSLGGTEQSAANTAAQHAVDLAGGRTWSILQPADPLAAQNIPGPPEAKARIETDLRSGDIVISPSWLYDRDPGRFTWWRVNSMSGQTLGVGSTGMGQDLAEWAVIIWSESVAACQVVAVGASIAFRVWVGAARIAACANPAVGYVLSLSKASGTPVTTVVEELASGAVAAGGFVLFGSK